MKKSRPTSVGRRVASDRRYGSHLGASWRQPNVKVALHESHTKYDDDNQGNQGKHVEVILRHGMWKVMGRLDEVDWPAIV